MRDEGSGILNSILIRIEGLIVLLAVSFFYFSNGYSWGLYLLLLLLPDVFMLGYAVNNKVGAYLYNFAHTITTPFLILVIGYILSVQFIIMVSLIWIAHIGMDRVLGFGLKYKTGFKDTHIQRL